MSFKVNIRSNSFETNSSSMHSLILTKKNEYITPEEVKKDFQYEINENNQWTGKTYDDECFIFGRRPFDILVSFYDKARYCVGNFHSSDGIIDEYKDKYDELLKVLKEYVGCDGIKVPIWNTSYDEDEDGNENKKIFYNAGSDDFILGEWLNEKNISVREFLTNKKYIVILDGDEYGDWERYKKSGLINLDMIEKEIPTDFNCDVSFCIKPKKTCEKAIEILKEKGIVPTETFLIEDQKVNSMFWVNYKEADETRAILTQNNITFK